MIPEIDSQIGILVYSTNFAGTGGKIRQKPEDFEVSEVISDNALKSIKNDVGESGYAVYKLRKKRIDTNHAIADIYRKKGIRLKSLGLKDASAITEQFVCSQSKTKEIR